MRGHSRGSNEIMGTLLLTGVIIVILAISAFALARFVDIKTVVHKFFGHRVYDVKKPSDNLVISVEPPESIDLRQMQALRIMLEEERFDHLNMTLAVYQKDFENNQIDEYKVYDAYRAFSVTLAHYEDLFQRWIEATPDSYQPYLSLASYYCAKGWESRGFKWKSETSREQLETMGFYFNKAEDNLKIALGINPNLMVAYDLLIAIYNANGDIESEDDAIAGAMKLFPYSFLVKVTASWAKEPRWGGSYEKMESIAEAAESFSVKNPKLTILYGFIYFDQANRFRKEKDYEKALAMLDRALQYGEHWSFYEERANIYYFDLEAYDQALAAANRTIELRPVRYEGYLIRARAHFALENYDNALTDIQTAEAICPGASQIQQWRTWASEVLLSRGHKMFKTNLPEAVRNYDLAIEFDETDFELYYWRGIAYSHMDDFESAMQDLTRAIEIDPRHFKSYQIIDSLLAKRQQWESIIGYWDAFIELEPDNADAYYERSGAHYHNRDFKNAIIDLKKACDLGNKSACKRFDQVKNEPKFKGLLE